MSKFDWFLVGLALSPFFWAVFEAVWAIFSNAFAEWLKDRS